MRFIVTLALLLNTTIVISASVFSDINQRRIEFGAPKLRLLETKKALKDMARALAQKLSEPDTSMKKNGFGRFWTDDRSEKIYFSYIVQSAAVDNPLESLLRIVNGQNFENEILIQDGKEVKKMNCNEIGKQISFQWLAPTSFLDLAEMVSPNTEAIVHASVNGENNIATIVLYVKFKEGKSSQDKALAHINAFRKYRLETPIQKTSSVLDAIASEVGRNRLLPNEDKSKSLFKPAGKQLLPIVTTYIDVQLAGYFDPLMKSAITSLDKLWLDHHEKICSDTGLGVIKKRITGSDSPFTFSVDTLYKVLSAKTIGIANVKTNGKGIIVLAFNRDVDDTFCAATCRLRSIITSPSKLHFSQDWCETAKEILQTGISEGESGVGVGRGKVGTFFCSGRNAASGSDAESLIAATTQWLSGDLEGTSKETLWWPRCLECFLVGRVGLNKADITRISTHKGEMWFGFALCQSRLVLVFVTPLPEIQKIAKPRTIVKNLRAKYSFPELDEGKSKELSLFAAEIVTNKSIIDNLALDTTTFGTTGNSFAATVWKFKVAKIQEKGLAAQLIAKICSDDLETVLENKLTIIEKQLAAFANFEPPAPAKEKEFKRPSMLTEFSALHTNKDLTMATYNQLLRESSDALGFSYHYDGNEALTIAFLSNSPLTTFLYHEILFKINLFRAFTTTYLSLDSPRPCIQNLRIGKLLLQNETTSSGSGVSGNWNWSYIRVGKDEGSAKIVSMMREVSQQNIRSSKDPSNVLLALGDNAIVTETGMNGVMDLILQPVLQIDMEFVQNDNYFMVVLGIKTDGCASYPMQARTLLKQIQSGTFVQTPVTAPVPIQKSSTPSVSPPKQEVASIKPTEKQQENKDEKLQENVRWFGLFKKKTSKDSTQSTTVLAQNSTKIPQASSAPQTTSQPNKSPPQKEIPDATLKRICNEQAQLNATEQWLDMEAQQLADNLVKHTDGDFNTFIGYGEGVFSRVSFCIINNAKQPPSSSSNSVDPTIQFINAIASAKLSRSANSKILIGWESIASHRKDVPGVVKQIMDTSHFGCIDVIEGGLNFESLSNTHVDSIRWSEGNGLALVQNNTTTVIVVLHFNRQYTSNTLRSLKTQLNANLTAPKNFHSYESVLKQAKLQFGKESASGFAVKGVEYAITFANVPYYEVENEAARLSTTDLKAVALRMVLEAFLSPETLDEANLCVTGSTTGNEILDITQLTDKISILDVCQVANPAKPMEKAVDTSSDISVDKSGATSVDKFSETSVDKSSETSPVKRRVKKQATSPASIRTKSRIDRLVKSLAPSLGISSIASAEKPKVHVLQTVFYCEETKSYLTLIVSSITADQVLALRSKVVPANLEITNHNPLEVSSCQKAANEIVNNTTDINSLKTEYHVQVLTNTEKLIKNSNVDASIAGLVAAISWSNKIAQKIPGGLNDFGIGTKCDLEKFTGIFVYKDSMSGWIDALTEQLDHKQLQYSHKLSAEVESFMKILENKQQLSRGLYILEGTGKLVTMFKVLERDIKQSTTGVFSVFRDCANIYTADKAYEHISITSYGSYTELLPEVSVLDLGLIAVSTQIGITVVPVGKNVIIALIYDLTFESGILKPYLKEFQFANSNVSIPNPETLLDGIANVFQGEDLPSEAMGCMYSNNFTASFKVETYLKENDSKIHAQMSLFNFIREIRSGKTVYNKKQDYFLSRIASANPSVLIVPDSKLDQHLEKLNSTYLLHANFVINLQSSKLLLLLVYAPLKTQIQGKNKENPINYLSIINIIKKKTNAKDFLGKDKSLNEWTEIVTSTLANSHGNTTGFLVFGTAVAAFGTFKLKPKELKNNDGVDAVLSKLLEQEGEGVVAFDTEGNVWDSVFKSSGVALKRLIIESKNKMGFSKPVKNTDGTFLGVVLVNYERFDEKHRSADTYFKNTLSELESWRPSINLQFFLEAALSHVNNKFKSAATCTFTIGTKSLGVKMLIIKKNASPEGNTKKDKATLNLITGEKLEIILQGVPKSETQVKSFVTSNVESGEYAVAEAVVNKDTLYALIVKEKK